MQQMKEDLPGHIFVPHLHWCSYWHTYSRVLATPKTLGEWVEVDVSPINGWSECDAAKQVAGTWPWSDGCRG